MGQIILPGTKSAFSRFNFHAILGYIIIHIWEFVHLWLPKGWTGRDLRHILAILLFSLSFALEFRSRGQGLLTKRTKRKFVMVRLKKRMNPDEYKQQQREQLESFLLKNGFANVNDPAPSGSEGAVRFESLTPLEVAQSAGNSELVEILLEAGAKRSAEGMGLGLRSMSSMWSRVMSGGSDVQVVNPTRPSKSCLRKSSWDDDDEILTVLL